MAQYRKYNVVFNSLRNTNKEETGPITVPAEAMLLIIGFPLVWIAKDFIGLGYFLELEQCRGVVLVQVGVELFG
jgi:hypothetical protein